MSATDRVRAWREKLRQDGLVPMTIWVRAETKARYEDLGLTHRCSPSELAQQALDGYRLEPSLVSATATDTKQIRTLIHAELAQATAGITVAVTHTVTETLTAMLPALIQATLAHVVSETVTATETETPARAVRAASPGSVSDIATATETDTPPPRGRQAAPLGQHKLTVRQAAALRAQRAAGAPIKRLMDAYGLSRATVHRYLKTPHAS